LHYLDWAFLKGFDNFTFKNNFSLNFILHHY
jgi:hypothetical protein